MTQLPCGQKSIKAARLFVEGPINPTPTSRAILCSKLLLAGGEVPLLILDGEVPKIYPHDSVILSERSMVTGRYSGRQGRVGMICKEVMSEPELTVGLRRSAFAVARMAKG